MSGSAEQELRAYVEYFRDLGVYELYAREQTQWAMPQRWGELPKTPATRPVQERAATVPAAAAKTPAAPTGQAAAATEAVVPRVNASRPPTSYFNSELSKELAAPMPKPVSFDALAPLPVEIVPAGQRGAALEAVRTEIGDCTRCPLAYAGRHKIVFADGDANARLMFVGEGPGADEDAQGLPFVGKAGQLLNNMILAMGLKREEVYIANIVKCRPPGNRTPEFAEASTCSQFLVKQIDIVRPKVIVALGSTAATYLLGVRQSLSSLRGRWYSTRGAKLAVTYHPAFLLRDPRQKAQAWKDLQMVMAELGLKPAAKKTS
jgi:DNA polymerase